MLLRHELASARWEPQTIAMSGITDCYQPAERKPRITRGVLEVLNEFRNPGAIVISEAQQPFHVGGTGSAPSAAAITR